MRVCGRALFDLLGVGLVGQTANQSAPAAAHCRFDMAITHTPSKQEKGIRKTMVGEMREEFKHLDLTFSIGGQISFDLFPKGWDKTYCLRYLDEKARCVLH